MRAKFGAIVVDGRGKIGGHVMSKNRGGSYMRTKKSPANPRSIAQLGVRSRMASNSQAWKGLGAAVITSWNTAAKLWSRHNIFGDKHNPSGFNLYMWLNNNLGNIGSTLLTNPPLAGAVGAFVTFSATMAKGTPAVSLAFTDPIPATAKVIIRATPGIGAGKTYIKNQLRQIGVLTTADTTPKDALSLYTAKYGVVPVAGQKVFFTATFVTIATGQAGSPIECSCVVSA